MIKLKNLLLEYINEPVAILKRYLTQSDEEKKKEVGLNAVGVDDFLTDNYPDIAKKYISLEYYEANEKLSIDHPEIFDKWSTHVFKNLDNYFESFEGYPTWNYCEYRGIIKNQWLIHFSDDADSIWAEQKFKYGVEDYTKLGLTTYLPDIEKRFGGYNFAYDLNDYIRYGRERFRWKYGKEAVVFKASGIKTWHWGDEEPQVIFYGPSATDIIGFYERRSNGDWYVRTNYKISRDLFHGDLDDVVTWATSNYQQYKRALMP